MVNVHCLNNIASVMKAYYGEGNIPESRKAKEKKEEK